ncbi:MAG TPA: hydantoinase/oxoprolinase family protein [Acidimicrobiia bacterium]|nr:hydantoinase/oxoprolinase family protein [Acidimicrobiia bacterium]
MSETGGRYYLGVDVGGTFTDVVLAGSDGSVRIGKVLTTPGDPRDGIVAGIRAALDGAGVETSAVSRVVHGTTLATNVVIERSGGPVALVTTEGFADVLRLGREARVEEDRYDLFFDPVPPPVDPRLTFEARERMDAHGKPLVALTAGALDDVVARVVAAAPSGIAVCFLHAYVNPEHERAVTAALRDALPETFVVASHEIWPEIREYERAMTTVVCAVVGPVMAGYLDGLQARLGELGITCPVEIMESSGGVMSAARAARQPVLTVESGGAAGVTAAGIVGHTAGFDDVISFDMGGTTAKAGIVRHGRPAITHDFQVGGKGSFGGTRAGTGVPLKIPVVDLAEVGAGGGSIAWVDAGGALRVGPRSAGADPGPACYARGGTEPTVTDANFLLGFLDPAGLAGGVTLSRDLAAEAMTRVAEPLGLTVLEAARAVHEIVNATMAAAIRVVTVQRGIDPREFTLVGFGGAGPMHAARLAETFGIPAVVVPWAAGVASAVGLVSSDLAVDLVQTHVTDLPGDVESLEAVFAALEHRGRGELGAGDDRAGGADAGGFVVTRSADLRARGQAHQLTVELPPGPFDAADVPMLTARFHEAYRDAYGIDTGAPAQFVNARVRVVRRVDKLTRQAEPVTPHDASVARAGERAVLFPDLPDPVETPVLDWTRLEPGAELAGPAVVEGPDTTVVVPPGWGVAVDRWGNLLLRREIAQKP